MNTQVIVEQISLNENALNENEYKDVLQINVLQNDTLLHCFEMRDGEPEDNSLGRNFSDCYNVLKLMKAMYELGRDGVDVTFSTTVVDLDDI